MSDLTTSRCDCVSICDNCGRCRECCGGSWCDECGDYICGYDDDSFFCGECSKCENCCDCVVCEKCGERIRERRIIRDYCTNCSKCNGCCDCEDSETEEKSGKEVTKNGEVIGVEYENNTLPGGEE